MFCIVSASRDVGNEDAGKEIDSMSPIQVGKTKNRASWAISIFPL